MVRKNFRQAQQQESKNKPPSAKKRKRGWMIFGGVIVAIFTIIQINSTSEQARLEKDNTPIVISDVDDNIKLDYRTNRREISARISGISSFAEVKISENRVEIHDHKDSAGSIKYETQPVASSMKLKTSKRVIAMFLSLLLMVSVVVIRLLRFIVRQKLIMIKKDLRKLLRMLRSRSRRLRVSQVMKIYLVPNQILIRCQAISALHFLSVLLN